MAVFVIGAIVELVAFSQLRRLSKNLRKGNDWVANRFALATQGQIGQGSGEGRWRWRWRPGAGNG